MRVVARKNIHEHRIDDEQNYQNLTSHREYTVIGIDDENYRILNDANEPILYPKKLFEVIDDRIPSGWIRKEYSEDEYYVDPSEFSEPGFYEDYFDKKDEAIDVFNKNINKYK